MYFLSYLVNLNNLYENNKKMFRYSHISPITRHNNVHYPLQNVIRDKAWKKNKEKNERNEKKKVSVPKTKI